ncbi:MAG: hypothetical protein RSB86_17355 [Comamonas sp.]|uniref:hypothetical protein n=1 Tax=Comamonas sp. TaxID=34028 RepID=UPI002FC713E9
MAERKPLVLVNGMARQLPAGDSIVGAGCPGMIVQYELVTVSKTVTAYSDGMLDIFCSGASGGGGVGFNGTFLGGPGAGEVAVKRSIPVRAGDSFVVTIGAGGASVSRATAGLTPGNAGGDTTITGPGVAITVHGGMGAPGGTTKPVAGGLGGTGGAGGDVHYPGGDGGDVLATSTATFGAAGGGAVAAIPTPQAARKGGSLTSGGVQHAGGAGVGGVGSSGSGSSSGGGGSGGPASGLTGGPNFFGVLIQASPLEVLASIAGWGLDVFGGGASHIGPAGPGGGGAGRYGDTLNTQPGIFGGGGGIVSQVTINLSSSPSMFGSGRNVVMAFTPANIASGAGGSGMAIFIFRSN